MGAVLYDKELLLEDTLASSNSGSGNEQFDHRFETDFSSLILLLARDLRF